MPMSERLHRRITRAAYDLLRIGDANGANYHNPEGSPIAYPNKEKDLLEIQELGTPFTLLVIQELIDILPGIYSELEADPEGALSQFALEKMQELE